MSYVVFARRFRPQSFDDVIGQEHISKTLKNAIKDNRVAHAYLFSGPRGVGKTTTARILAKALNCKNGPTAQPCNECPNCKDILAGSSVDVQEIDGASNRGIDEIRALRDNVKFAPASSKYKIYIIDEAHQITDAAFNALLKTLEEPPSHVVFILATTESHKIPITILSRCQRYRFRLLNSKEIASCIDRIVKSDKFEIEEDAIKLITESAAGSLRDALSLLDQVVSFVTGKITAKDVRELLGFIPGEIVTTATMALSKNDGATLMSMVKDMNDNGHSLVQFARDLREHFRKLMLFRLNPEVLELTTEDKKMLESQKDIFSDQWLVRSGRLLSKALDEMRYNDQPRLMLELYLLRLAQPFVDLNELVERLEKFEKGMPDDESQIQQPVVYTPKYIEQEKPKGVVSQVATPEFGGTPKPREVVTETKETTSAQPVVPNLEGDNSRLWADVVMQFKRQKPLFGNAFSNAVFLEIVGNSIVVVVKSKFEEEGIKRNQQFIEALIKTIFGKPLGLKVTIGSAAQSPAIMQQEVIISENENVVSPVAEVYQVDFDSSQQKSKELPPELQKISSKFPGKVVKKK